MARFDLILGEETARVLEPVTGAPEKDPEGEYNKKLFDRYSTAQRAEWLTEATSCVNFKRGVQWTAEEEQSLEADGLSPVTVNVIHPAVESLKASLTANPPQFSVTGREMSDMKVASIIQDLIQDIWLREDGNRETGTVVEDMTVQGLGGYYVYVNPIGDNGHPQICFSAVDPKDLWVDPFSKDRLWRDAAHVIVSKTVSAEVLQSMFPAIGKLLPMLPKALGASLTPSGIEVGSRSQATDGGTDYYHLIDRYSRIKQTTHVITYPKTGEEWVANDEQVQALLGRTALLEETANDAPQLLLDDLKVRGASEYISRYGNVWHYALDPNDPNATPFPVSGDEQNADDEQSGLKTIPGSTVRLKQLTFAELIKEGALIYEKTVTDRIKQVVSVSDVTLYKRILPTSHYPVIPVINNHDRSPYGDSDVRLVRSLQVYTNKMRALILAHAANSAGVKVFIGRGTANAAELKKQFRRAGAEIIEVDMDMGAPIIAAPPPLPNELYLDEQRHRQDIQEILGAYTLSQGDTSQAPDTFKGTVAIDEYGQRRVRNKRDVLEGALVQMGRVMIDFIQAYYTEPRVIRLTRPNNIMYRASINYIPDNSAFAAKINDMSVGKYDLAIIAGSMLPINRWARFEYYKQLYEMGAIDRTELLKHAEVLDVQEVLERMSEIEQLRGALEQAGEQIKMLKGDLQTAQREAMHANQRAELHKFKADIDAYRNKADVATTLYSQRLSDEVKNARREAKSEE